MNATTKNGTQRHQKYFDSHLNIVNWAEKRLTEVLNNFLHHHEQAVQKNKENNLSKYFGSLKFDRDALEIQKEMRDEWS